MPKVKEALGPEDLVLHLNEQAKNFDLTEYEDFLFEHCGDWDFQKEAVRSILRFFLSGEYSSTRELFEENYTNNHAMQEFATKEQLLKELPFPDKLSCTIDLATGTGKTWVMYAVARILLAANTVDRVLVLGPSKTIKYQLHKRFTEFSQNAILTDALPRNSKIKVPGIKHSDQTIEEGDICVDNVHKTYDHVSSSISDSLEGKGERTLIINDEAHHLLNPKGSGNQKTMNEWNNFIKDPKYGFKYVLNVSGTPYKGNTYFYDVLYRYSIREAINARFVKDIHYLTKDENKDWKQKWKTILHNHEELKKRYPKSQKHITIVITNSIQNANSLETELKNFLEKNTPLSDEEVDKQVLTVTSSPQHADNREKLKTIDQKENPVEWIVSVSMLTEGWDVANVFQIVPHDSRAFNSKLLISQVLGRGLRVPAEYQNSQEHPFVWVYNHAAWSSKIDHLVNEVAEIHSEIHSYSDKKSKYNFELPYFNIDKEIKSSKKIEKKDEVSPPKTLGFQTTVTKTSTIRLSVKERRQYYEKTNIKDQIKFYAPEEAALEVYTSLYMIDYDRGTDLTKRVSKDYILNLIKKELKKISENKVSEENLQRAKSSFNVLIRQFTGVSHIEDTYKEILLMKTSEMNVSKITESSFKHYGGLITTKENFKKLDQEDKEILEKIKQEIQKDKQTTLHNQSYIQARIIDDLKEDEYRCPLNVAILSHRPEREFAEQFVRKYTEYVDAWVKAPNQGFFTIPYIHRPGTHSIQRNFNPDFFIKIKNRLLVIEIKCEDDTTVVNKDKLEGAETYFAKLNESLKGKQSFEFYFLEPGDYTMFFEKVIVKGESFKGKLQTQLEEKSREDLKEDRSGI